MYDVNIVEENIPVEMLDEREIFWIAFFRHIGCRLVNLTDGGKGVLGIDFSTESRKKMSVSRKGIKRPEFSLEWRRNMSIAHKHSEKAMAAIRKAQLACIGKTTHPNTKLAVGAYARLPKPPQHRENISKALKGKPKSKTAIQNSVNAKKAKRNIRLADEAKNLKHGTLRTYTVFKCRCEKCREANTLYWNEHSKKKNQI